MPADTAYQIVHDELMLDGNARLNLATFVTTWMEPAARALMAECLDKNMIDKDEYPQTAELERRCVAMLARLWGSADDEPAVGCSTTGSSEAAMLGGLALKRRWAQRRRAAGLADDRPNLVMGANVQVCWEKFCRYWDVEPRLVPVGDGQHVPDGAGRGGALRREHDRRGGDPRVDVRRRYEPVRDIAAALDRLQDEQGLDVPIHVDAASGGFVAPFIDPDLEWDFRIARVASINASGHKYGLVYPGVGWAVWRDSAALPEDLDLRRRVPRRRHADVRAELLAARARRSSRSTTRCCASASRATGACSRHAATTHAGSRRRSREIGPFELISDGSDIPVFAFRLRDDVSGYTVFDVSETLRIKGWLVPAYHMPPAMQDVAVLRVVVRNDFSRDLAGMLLDHLRWAVQRLERGAAAPATRQRRSAFHH